MDKTLSWCHHSNETSLSVLSNCTIFVFSHRAKSNVGSFWRSERVKLDLGKKKEIKWDIDHLQEIWKVILNDVIIIIIIIYTMLTSLGGELGLKGLRPSGGFLVSFSGGSAKKTQEKLDH